MVWGFGGIVLFLATIIGLFWWAMCKAASDADDQLEMMREIRRRQEVAAAKETVPDDNTRR